jgi:hypothetical protein
MKPCLRCLSTQTDVLLYSEQDLQIHEVVGHYKCEVCSEFFNDNAARGQHLAEAHGKMYLSKEEPIWPDGIAELVDIPGWQKQVVKPQSGPADPDACEEWLRGFAWLMVDAAANEQADQLLKNAPEEFREQAQYVNWVEATYPKSARAWERVRFQKRERSKDAKAKFLAEAWAKAEFGAPTYLKEKGF